MASENHPARTLPAPQTCCEAYRLRISLYYSCHLLHLQCSLFSNGPGQMRGHPFLYLHHLGRKHRHSGNAQFR